MDISGYLEEINYLYMNNFQLNNTSVFLGGQCKWDVILTNRDDELVVTGFQLTPISDNIPFNKRGETSILNDNHSYTLKKFCNDIKENFWSYNPCLIEHTRDNQQNTTGYYDDSFISGMKRAETFQVYGKQYEYLQPLWLEHLREGEYLKFKFNIYSINKEGVRNKIDSKVLKLNLSTNEDDTFHNSFINYLNDWLRYLNILGEKGNNRVMFIDIQNNIAQIDGVSTLSGQLSGKVSCDYVINNLLSYERPNIETDYILCSLFKNHNTIASQLLNLNFCFDSYNILDPFLLNQLKGYPISVDCEVSTVYNDVETPIERRSLFTNYEFISREIYNPFLFMNDVKARIDPVSGQLSMDYDVKYQESFYLESPGDPLEEKSNVLDYLRDFKIENLKDKNKITQPVCHWGYSTHFQDTFNFYEGYHPYIISNIINRSMIGYDLAKYYIKVFEGTGVNGISMPSSTIPFTPQNGTLDWIYPFNILYFNRLWSTNINSDITDFLRTFDSPFFEGKTRWCIKDSLLKEYYHNETSTLTFIYVQEYIDFVSIKNLFTTESWIMIEDMYDEGIQAYVFYKDNDGIKDYIIVGNDLDIFSLSRISDIAAVLADNDFTEFVNKIIEYSNNFESLYDYYGFGCEIEVGRDELDNECYYKADSIKTFVYRKCGELSPYMIVDPDFDLNFYYYQSITDKSINKIENLNYSFEDKELGKGKTLVLLDKLIFSLEKASNNPKTVKQMIREYLAQVYGYDINSDQKLIDYIYNLYDINFKFEYKELTSLDTIVYNVNMILK